MTVLNRLILDCFGHHTSLKITKFTGLSFPWMKELDHNLITKNTFHKQNLHVRKTGPIFETLETNQDRKQKMQKTLFSKKFLTPKNVEEILKIVHLLLNSSEEVLETDTN